MGATTDPISIITELAENGSLYDVIHKRPEKIDKNWNRTLRMLIDSARGMAYLHNQEPPILHRDMKSQNILIDITWKAKIGNFPRNFCCILIYLKLILVFQDQ